MHMLALLENPTIADAVKTAIGDRRQAYTLAFIGLAGSLVPVILSWTKDLGVTSQRLKQLDEGVKRIAFWEQWLKLSSAIGDEAAEIARQRVRQELDLICTAFSSASAELHSEAFTLQKLKMEFKSKLAGLSSLQRTLLLYKPPRPVAWVPRFFFYLFSAITSFGILFEFIVIFDKAEQNRASLIDTFFFFSIFTAVVAVGFRYLSLSMEKPHKQLTDTATALPTVPTP